MLAAADAPHFPSSRRALLAAAPSPAPSPSPPLSAAAVAANVSIYDFLLVISASPATVSLKLTVAAGGAVGPAYNGTLLSNSLTVVEDPTTPQPSVVYNPRLQVHVVPSWGHARRWICASAPSASAHASSAQSQRKDPIWFVTAPLFSEKKSQKDAIC